MSELRQDLISGDWIILAPGRARRPEELAQKKVARKASQKSTCPFENVEKPGDLPPIALYPDAKNWRIAVVPNKYPALAHSDGCAIDFHEGPYHAKTGVGDHELVITRDHSKNFADLEEGEAAELFAVFAERHRAITDDRCVSYISTFFNWGSTAGASVWHPHYQIFALPIIPPHAAHSLRGSESYFKKNKRCVRCDVITFERKEKKRIIAENRHAIAFAPYASHKPFEISVAPKEHFAFFSKTPRAVLDATASLLQDSLRRLKKKMNDPDLNFFIHGAPVDGGTYPHHHWHVEVMPKISVSAGFEISTGIDINVMDPDGAAKILRGE